MRRLRPISCSSDKYKASKSIIQASLAQRLETAGWLCTNEAYLMPAPSDITSSIKIENKNNPAWFYSESGYFSVSIYSLIVTLTLPGNQDISQQMVAAKN